MAGGATGIGKEICRVLGVHGACIAMASRKQENLEAAAEEEWSGAMDRRATMKCQDQWSEGDEVVGAVRTSR